MFDKASGLAIVYLIISVTFKQSFQLNFHYFK